MHGLTFLKNGDKQIRFIILPSKQFSYAYLLMLMEDMKSLGYNVTFEERDNKYILKISDKMVVIGE
ncbi:hypothetical protein AFV9_gp67 [Betalipothrixvirus uzonense]|uniref:Uncharacterized protein n=1 Tax=Betalipothrixvirus uzonense TaxID=512792 RepID=B2CRP4_9VIRU|nr:hypothetical protein AFV9_gp67 [Acidianus filamentous virus 9]ACB37301.1 hypothetical protein [Acidianus filamentous virus 9]